MGELTSGRHPVMVKDVKIARRGTTKKIKFILRTSKTHGKHNHPQIVKITSTRKIEENSSNRAAHQFYTSDSPKYCPYEILEAYMRIRPKYQDRTEPFFIFKDWSPVKPEDMRKTLKSMINRCQMDANLYNTHSFRGGDRLISTKWESQFLF